MVKKPYLCILMGLALLLSGCETPRDPAVICEELTLFQSQISQTFTSEEYLSWILETQGVELSDIRVLSTRPERFAYVWTTENYDLGVGLENNQVDDIRIRIEGPGVPARVMAACFGEPDVYRALHDARFHNVRGGDINFHLVYTSGVFVGGTQLYRRLSDVPLSLDEDYAMDVVIFTPPGSPLEILQQVRYSAPSDGDWRIRPWPEDWADIQIDLTPEMQRYLQGN